MALFQSEGVGSPPALLTVDITQEALTSEWVEAELGFFREGGSPQVLPAEDFAVNEASTTQTDSQEEELLMDLAAADLTTEWIEDKLKFFKE